MSIWLHSFRLVPSVVNVIRNFFFFFPQIAHWFSVALLNYVSLLSLSQDIMISRNHGPKKQQDKTFLGMASIMAPCKANGILPLPIIFGQNYKAILQINLFSQSHVL